MSPKIRKLIGAVILLVFIPLYAMVTVAVAVARLPGTSVLAHLAFFSIAGLLWVIPAGLVIRWMLRPRDERA